MRVLLSTNQVKSQTRKTGRGRERFFKTGSKKGKRCSDGYPPAEGRIEQSQRNSSKKNNIIFSLKTEEEEEEEEE